MSRRSTHPRSVWERAVAELAAGATRASVARRLGVTVAAVGYWKAKLGKPTPRLLPVVAASALRRPAMLELVVGECVLRFTDEVAPGFVGDLAQTLRSS